MCSDSLQLRQLHNQVLLEQQQDPSEIQSTTQSPSLSTSFPSSSPATMNIPTSTPHVSAQIPSASRSPMPTNTLPQAFNYTRPKQFIAAQNVRSHSPSFSPLPTSITISQKTEKDDGKENYFGFSHTQHHVMYPSSPTPVSYGYSTNAIGQTTPLVPPLLNFQPRIASPVHNSVAFLSSVLPSLPSAPPTNAMGLPMGAPVM